MLDREGWRLMGVQAVPALAAVLTSPVCLWGGLALWCAWAWTAARAMALRYVP